jgi:hypothetical protein
MAHAMCGDSIRPIAREHFEREKFRDPLSECVRSDKTERTPMDEGMRVKSTTRAADSLAIAEMARAVCTSRKRTAPLSER